MPLTYRGQRYFPIAVLTEPLALNAQQETTCIYRGQSYKRKVSTVVSYRPIIKQQLTYRGAQYTAHL